MTRFFNFINIEDIANLLPNAVNDGNQSPASRRGHLQRG